MMHAELENLVGAFEGGRLTRRQLLVRLSGLMALAATASGTPATAGPGSTFQAVGLNHIALDVTDIPRSRDFYVSHLGLKVSSESRTNCFLRCGDQFVALFRAGQGGMNHYCYSVPDYSVTGAAEKLTREGLKPRPAGNRIYFDDPDGLEVQLSSPDHRV